MAADARVLLGVAGWSYADWQGIVYPRGCKDTLRAVAQRVALIEINSTFYAKPSAKNCASWVQRTLDLGTRFTAKLPQEFTHARRFDAAFAAQVREGFAPLVESGRLLGLLAQFNHEFPFAAAAVEHVARLAGEFLPVTPLFVELRHRSWNADDALAAMRGLGVGVLELDYPGTVGGFSRDVSGVPGQGGVGYLRLHGRNRAWFRKGAGRDEVYDWHYSAAEVAQLAARIARIQADKAQTLVIANNHFHGKAMQVVEDLLAYYGA
ncbi:MAG: DUF72 domain-containing protein [Planctomycetes bacterium]|nr:DUF72 domain-containing protein [Planctomycetota bacterium]MCC7399556.1 DUF72 domain-containing protein [Planctomycetota bacterium]